MMESTQLNDIDQAAATIDALRSTIHKAMVGQSAVIDQVLIALVASGHVLIEGVPGLGKTLLVRALAKALSLEYGRIQFTPDMLPSDITGHAVLDPATRQLRVVRGPVFTQLLLADEINRAPAKVQSALLEGMQERQVTIGAHTYPLPKPFFVMATQNPIEQEGTYPLPEAQLDRFMFNIKVDYPSYDEEKRILELATREEPAELVGIDVGDVEQRLIEVGARAVQIIVLCEHCHISQNVFPKDDRQSEKN